MKRPATLLLLTLSMSFYCYSLIRPKLVACGLEINAIRYSEPDGTLPGPSIEVDVTGTLHHPECIGLAHSLIAETEQFILEAHRLF